jgi:hypothetical protein
MKNVATLTVEDVYMISYLVMRGWKHQGYPDCWIKEGFYHTKTQRAERCNCGGCWEDVETNEFDLEEAYYVQEEIDANPDGASAPQATD